MTRGASEPSWDELDVEIRALRSHLTAAADGRAGEIAATHPVNRRSAANLLHYVELRRHDVRRLQAHLASRGLSSLGRCESNVLATVEGVHRVITQLAGREAPGVSSTIAINDGGTILRANTERLLGPARAERDTRIMVTLPSQAADDETIVARMVAAGMDVARINCAHDDRAAWTRMVDAVRSHPGPDGRPCRVAMDLGGPKLRTGPFVPGPRVVKVSPARDLSGRVVTPGRVWLSGVGPTPPDAGAVQVVPLEDPDWTRRRQPGDRIHLVDARGAQRAWLVESCTTQGCLVRTDRTTYVASRSMLSCDTASGADEVAVGELPERPQAHRVGPGDTVVLTRSLEPAEPTPIGAVHRIGCTLPEAFVHVRPGHRVWLDDGKFGGIVERVGPDEIELTVTEARARGANLKAGKGINLPDTDLPLDALTAKDLDDLDFVARHADVVNLSFVRRPADVARLQSELHRRGADHVGIVLKIENVVAFSNLPELLLTALRSPHSGVMIARGDLAVEVGFERLAEVQEEIMWACEAAHVPVVWATQVLDTMARTGEGTRAEITDAAMAERAECVMLNKGPYIERAIDTLDSVLRRMEHHHDKKRSLLRRLHAWDRLTAPAQPDQAASGATDEAPFATVPAS